MLPNILHLQLVRYVRNMGNVMRKGTIMLSIRTTNFWDILRNFFWVPCGDSTLKASAEFRTSRNSAGRVQVHSFQVTIGICLVVYPWHIANGSGIAQLIKREDRWDWERKEAILKEILARPWTRFSNELWKKEYLRAEACPAES